MAKATAVANPNIAFIKYWGKANDTLNLPANPSLSMNLAALTTITTVEFRPGLPRDVVMIDGAPAPQQALARVVAHLDRVRRLAGIEQWALVESRSDFPVGTGLASSASAFAALTLAATQAAGLWLDSNELSRLARRGSGSACRSVPGGYALWDGDRDKTSFARQVAPPEYWALRDVVAIISHQHKKIGSHDGHGLANGSPFHASRVAAVPELLMATEEGLRQRALGVIGPAMEADSLAMHGVMLTSQPPLLYWEPATVTVLKAVRAWRGGGLGVFFTMDAGPNVHCICEAGDAAEVRKRLLGVQGVQEVLTSGPGGEARPVEHHLF